MPIYEYQCEQCGHQLEALQKFSDPPLAVCPECEQPSLRKLVSAAGFVLKGTGWYVTDFRDSGKGSGKEKKDKANAAETGTETAKTDAVSKDAGAKTETSAKPAASTTTTPAKPSTDTSS